MSEIEDIRRFLDAAILSCEAIQWQLNAQETDFAAAKSTISNLRMRLAQEERRSVTPIADKRTAFVDGALWARSEITPHWSKDGSTERALAEANLRWPEGVGDE